MIKNDIGWKEIINLVCQSSDPDDPNDPNNPNTPDNSGGGTNDHGNGGGSGSELPGSPTDAGGK